MGVADLIDSGNIADAFTPVRRDKSNIVEVTGLAVQNSLDNHHLFSAQRLKSNALSDQQKQIEDIFGQDLFEIIGEEARTDDFLRYERTDQFLNDNKDIFQNVPRSAEVLENAREKARLSADEFNQATLNASGFESTAGSLIGGFAGTAIDPVNLVLLPLGAGAGRTVLQTVAIEAGLNAGIETLSQPSIAAWQREIGNEYGLSEAVTNVAFAALLGGGFAGVTRGARPAAATVFEHLSKSPHLPEFAKQPVKQLADWAHYKEANPYKEDIVDALDRHGEALNEVTMALENRIGVDNVIFDYDDFKPPYAQPIRSIDGQEASLLGKSSTPGSIPALFSSSSLSTVPSRTGSNITSVGSRSSAETQSLASISQRTASNSSPSNIFDTATISPLRNAGSVSIGRIDPTSTYIVYHPTKNVKKVVALAKENKPELKRFLQDSSKGIDGAEFYGARVKTESSLNNKQKGKGREVDGIGDVLGGRIVVDNYEAMRAVTENIKARARLIEFENKIKGKSGEYRAVHMIVTSKNGISAEIQIQPREIRDVQDQAHDIYKRWQNTRKKQLTKEEFKERNKDLKKSKKMFRDAWKKWEKRNKGDSFDDDGFVRPLVEDPVPSRTPADVLNDVNNTVLRSVEHFEKSVGPEVLDDIEVQRIRDAEVAELNRLVEEDPNFKVELDDDDIRVLFPGKTQVTMADIAAAREADANLIDAVRVCSTG